MILKLIGIGEVISPVSGTRFRREYPAEVQPPLLGRRRKALLGFRVFRFFFHFFVQTKFKTHPRFFISSFICIFVIFFPLAFLSILFFVWSSVF